MTILEETRNFYSRLDAATNQEEARRVLEEINTFGQRLTTEQKQRHLPELLSFLTQRVELLEEKVHHEVA